MKLLTQEVRRRLPGLYTQDGKGEDAIAQVKFFHPAGSGTWYASEADAIYDGKQLPLSKLPMNLEPEDVIFFGIANITDREFGYFMLSELSEFKGPFGLNIERDIYWTPRPLKDCR